MARHYTLHRPQPSGPRIDFAAELNPQQLEAVTAPPGPALVIAGAGSGKTRTLTYRVAYLMENGIRPEHILLLTFTNKAAREMCERVGALVTGDLMGLWGGTFHSMGARILRRHPNEAGFAPGFSIMDREDSEEMLDGVIATLGFDPKEKRFPKGGVLADVLSFQLNTGRKLDDVLLEKYPHFLEFSEHIADVRKKYEARKQKANALDFDDLLEKTVMLLKNNAAIAEHYQRQFQFILVDEYQDTNHLQNDFIEMLAARHHNVMVVGDDAQSIYSWRGVPFEITSGLRFFEQAHIKDVSAFLKWVVNPHDEVAFKRMVRLMPGVGPRSADALWDGVVRALAAAGTSNVQRPTSNVQSPKAAQSATTPNPPLASDSDEPTEALPETVANPWEGLPSIKSLLMPLKVPAKAQKAWEQCVFTLDELAPGGRLVPPSQMIHSVMEAIYDDYAQAKFPNYDQRREDLNTLANFSRQFESTQTFLDQLALLTTMDSNAASADDPERVTLSSVHQAKGLEWKVVFVIWLADGKFPTGRSLENPAAVEEERRLFYVAVTRAKDELYLSYPCMSFNSGYGDPLQRPSRFLAEIPKKLIEDWEVGGSF